jgi:hypothetical protein
VPPFCSARRQCLRSSLFWSFSVPSAARVSGHLATVLSDWYVRFFKKVLCPCRRAFLALVTR